MAMPCSSERVALRDGPVIDANALRLAWRLDDAGHDLRVGPDGSLLIGRAATLTAEDRAAIGTHRTDLVALAQYLDFLDTRTPLRGGVQ